jgi:hypothetical protein
MSYPRSITTTTPLSGQDYIKFKKHCNYSPCIVLGRVPVTDYSGIVVLSKKISPQVPSNLDTSVSFLSTYLIDPNKVLFGRNRCINLNGIL